MKKWGFYSLVVLCFFVFIGASGCVKTQQVECLKTVSEETVFKIGEITSSPESFKGKEVVLYVKNIGWRSCPYSVMVTRSDVVVTDDTGCIYVKGGLRRNLWGKQLIIRGVVRILKGKPYIEVENVEIKE